MIELTDQQVQALSSSGSSVPKLVDPRTGETFVLLRIEDYERLEGEAYDDTPWSREELQGLAWEATGAEDWDEFAGADEADRPSRGAMSSWSDSLTRRACAARSVRP